MTDSDGNIADLGPRIAAAIVDIIIIWVILFVLLGVVGFGAAVGGRGMFLGTPFIAGVFLLPILYFTIFEAYVGGQTPGKMVVKIKVVKENGAPCDLVGALIRNIMRIIDQLPFLYLLGLIIIATSDKNQRLGDMVANTLVVKAQ